MFDFVHHHLSLYGDNGNDIQAIRESFAELIPSLLSQSKGITHVVDYLSQTCLRGEGEFENMVDTLFPWVQFPERIDRNIAVSDEGILSVFDNLKKSGVGFKVITDASSAEAVLRTYPQLRSIISEHSVLIEPTNKIIIEDLVTSNDNLVIGMGGGIALDITKQSATLFNKGMVLIPTILSTNTFSTPVIYHEVINTHKDYTPSSVGRIPDFVIIDPMFLAQQDSNLNRLGFGDVIASYSAGYDWQIAVQDGQSKHNIAVENERQNLLQGLTTPIDLTDSSGIISLAEFLTRLSYCTFIEGVGSNPASGSEKIFSSAALNIFGESVYHGEMMMLGTLIMTYLQGQEIFSVAEVLKNVGFDFSLYSQNLDKEKLVSILVRAKEISLIKGRKTILDNYQLDVAQANEVVEKLLLSNILID